MNENIGGVSLDDIMAAASFDETKTEDVSVVSSSITENNRTDSNDVLSSKDNVDLDTLNSAVTINTDSGVIGGIPLDDIIAAADLDADNTFKTTLAETTSENVKLNFDNNSKNDSLNDKKEKKIVKFDTNNDDIKNDIIVKDNDDNQVDIIDDTNKDIAKAEKKSEFVTKLRKFYLFDFIYRTAKAKNWGLFVWLFLNFAFIEVFSMFGGAVGMIVAPIIYIISLIIALSPAGEFLLRQQNACREIKSKEVRDKVQPIFDKVYAEAREKNPNISPNVKLFMCDEESENAFATGRRTVCITKGLAKMDEDHITGILAHEFGHLAHRDTDNLLIVVVGNLLVTVITSIIGIVCNIFGYIGDIFTENTTLGKILPFHLITKFFSFLFVTVFMFLWTKLGSLLCLKGNKNQEFAADIYAAELGYAQNLVDAFDELEDAPSPKGLWAALTSSHPQTADRVMKLNEYIEEHKQNALS